MRSNITQDGDSLRVAVDWRLVLPRGPELAESARVEVGMNDGQVSQVSTVPADEHVDTLWVPAPAQGQTASGYSCVAPMTRGRLSRESCTPWQFVRPTAGNTQADSAPAVPPGKKPTASRVSRIEVQPAGMQVDLDQNGRCAAWQRANPGRSVWVKVNKEAVRECTGSNGKPTVAQFCAFAVLTRRPAGEDPQLREGGVLQRALHRVDRAAHGVNREPRCPAQNFTCACVISVPRRTPGSPIFRDT